MGGLKPLLPEPERCALPLKKSSLLRKKAHLAQDSAQKIHYRRLAISRLRSKSATKKLFDELVEQFAKREGGYTRIYKLALPRLGDASEMALIEFVEEPASKKKKKKAKKASKKTDTPKPETESTEEESEAKETDALETIETESNEIETTSAKDAESGEAAEESAKEEISESESTEEDVAEISDDDQSKATEPGEDSEEVSKESK